jgi:hypothetical protein
VMPCRSNIADMSLATCSNKRYTPSQCGVTLFDYARSKNCGKHGILGCIRLHTDTHWHC